MCRNFIFNLRTVLEKHRFQSKDIWNVDDTGVQTVQRPSKIVAEKGARQVGKTTSAERGQTVTLAAAVSAIGNFVTPLFIFPRVFYKYHFVQARLYWDSTSFRLDDRIIIFGLYETLPQSCKGFS